METPKIEIIASAMQNAKNELEIMDFFEENEIDFEWEAVSKEIIEADDSIGVDNLNIKIDRICRAEYDRPTNTGKILVLR